MKVIVYMEGKSDQRAIEALLSYTIEKLKAKNIALSFVGLEPLGSNKAYLVTKIPKKAAAIIASESDSVIIAMPDLYPYDCGCSHTSPKELFVFMNDLYRRSIASFDSYTKDMDDRFKVFCFKHDLEALVLAAREQLAAYLKMSPPSWDSWIKPVEDQNNEEPPKRIVGKLFRESNGVYKAATDAHMILGNADYRTIAERCPQCFKPFVEYIESLA